MVYLTMAGERIINRNPYLYGPGPVRRSPKAHVVLGKLPPLRRFTMAAVHGVCPRLLRERIQVLCWRSSDPWH
jgi:hypothetical protein